MGHEGVVADGLDGVGDGLLHGVEPGQPFLKVDAAVFHEVNGLLGNAPLLHVVDHDVAVDVLHAAVGVADDHDLFAAELVNGDEQTAHGAAEGAGDNAAGVFDDLGVAVFDAEGSRQELNQARVHAGDDGELFVGIFVGDKFFVALFSDELLVICENIFDHERSFLSL